MLAILGELCWLQFFKTVYLETSNVRFGSFFQNPVTYYIHIPENFDYGLATGTLQLCLVIKVYRFCMMAVSQVGRSHFKFGLIHSRKSLRYEEPKF